MKLFEVQDIVREHVGRDKISDPALTWAVQRGLREIEKHDNFYWMEAKSPIFPILDSQQEYEIAPIAPNFKESDVLLVSDRTATDPRWVEVIGPTDIKDTKVNFTESSSGIPAFWTLRDEDDTPTILVWPPLPDQDYQAQLFYYKWTSLPTAATSDSHEVLRRWPEALIYLATEQAMLISTKDPEAALVWKSLFINANPLLNTEYKRIKLFQKTRKSIKRYNGTPTQGTTTLTERLQNLQKGWF